MLGFISTQMTQIEQIDTDLFIKQFLICENLFNLCHLCAKKFLK